MLYDLSTTEDGERRLRLRPVLTEAPEEVVLEAWEQVLIPDVGDEGIRHVLYGGELLVGRGEATTEVVEAKLRTTLRLVAHTQGRGEVQRRAGDRRSRDTADDGVAADAR